eukprot:jgi/Botrbrau1/8684/Bobra.0087s0036.2
MGLQACVWEVGRDRRSPRARSRDRCCMGTPTGAGAGSCGSLRGPPPSPSGRSRDPPMLWRWRNWRCLSIQEGTGGWTGTCWEAAWQAARRTGKCTCTAPTCCRSGASRAASSGRPITPPLPPWTESPVPLPGGVGGRGAERFVSPQRSGWGVS